jgi:flagellar hook-associated protein 2
MSDISIPGVRSKYETDKLIEDLMKLERIPRTRAAERLEQVQLQKTVWLDVNRRLSRLRESSRNMYSFQNPFNDRIVKSADEASVSATATREAIEETRSIQIKSIASVDRYQSERLPTDYRVVAGNYTFKVGDSTVRLTFQGGPLRDFVEALNRKGTDIIRAQIVPVTSNSRVLVMESLKSGSGNRLSFADDAITLAIDTGIADKVVTTLRELPADRISRFEQALDTEKVTARDGTLRVASQAEAALRLPAPIPTSGLVLELEAEIVSIARPPRPVAPPGPAIPAIGGLDYEGISIHSATSEAVLPQWVPPPELPRRDVPTVLYLLHGNNQSTALNPLVPDSGYQTLTIPLPQDADARVAGIGIRNENSDAEVHVRSVRIFNPDEISGLRPKHAVSTAGDAKILMDGIEVTRPSNRIDDLIPGVILNLHQQSEKPVRLDIEPNRQAAKEAIIELVGNYNRLMAEINILTRKEQTIIDEITYFTEDEKKSFSERLGMFQGDMTLSQVRSRMQSIMMSAFPTREETIVLASFGISTDSRRGGGYDAARLRGYLEIEEKALDAALKDNFRKVRDAFGFDSDGDLIVDSGAAFAIDSLIRPYVETGGIIADRTRTLDSQIASQQRTIDSLDRQLAAKESDLKRKYGMMEGALNQMESTSNALNNYFPTNRPNN